MHQRSYREYTPGALWRTREENPRYLRVVGRVAIEDGMLLAELELQDRRVWLQEITGRVYDRGVLLGTAECVEAGGAEEIFT